MRIPTRLNWCKAAQPRRRLLNTSQSNAEEDTCLCARAHEHVTMKKRLRSEASSPNSSDSSNQHLHSSDSSNRHIYMYVCMYVYNGLSDATRAAGAMNGPSQYPPDLIEKVLVQSEHLWHAMSAKVALLHARSQVLTHHTHTHTHTQCTHTCIVTEQEANEKEEREWSQCHKRRRICACHMRSGSGHNEIERLGAFTASVSL